MTTPANPDDLVAFLRAIYDERERVARKAAAVCGCHTPATGWLFDDESTDGRILVAADPHPEQHRRLGRRWNGTYDGLFMAQHIADNDPAYVLADLDANRRILDLHADPHECPEWDRPLGETCTGYYGAEGCPTLRLLAAPHADRPGYREEWRPA